ncbi:NYN domain-containing protein [Mycena pura]|uniref:NYN domain-containing protein n=1 Tax=Mycena pura TaxID=153505 RepID=A0AAD6VSS2_9AGAR|nr:NYN domain-containing protein [Mycena pura]
MQPDSDVAIFWDYENCHAPSNVSGHEVVSGIRNVAHRYGSVKYFKAYMEITDARTFNRALSLRSELQSSGVSLTDCPHNGRKDVADQMIMVDMLAYAMDHPPPATLLLISSDRDFSYAVAVLRLRKYDIVVISLMAHASLNSQASVWLDWNTHVMGTCNSRVETASPSTLTQTPTARRASYFGESALVGPETEQPKPSAVSSEALDPVIGPSLEHPQDFAEREKPAISACRKEDILVFQPLVDVLEKLRAMGVTRPLRCTVGSELVALTKSAYADAGVEYFSEYTALAEQAGIILTGGSMDNAWISLLPQAGTTTAEKNKPSPKDVTSAVPTVHPLAGSSNQPSRQKAGMQVPPAFQPLVDVLWKHRANGMTRPPRSIVALELVGLAKTVYVQTGVQNFKQFTALAEAARVVKMGGTQGQAWISLHHDLIS